MKRVAPEHCRTTELQAVQRARGEPITIKDDDDDGPRMSYAEIARRLRCHRNSVMESEASAMRKLTEGLRDVWEWYQREMKGERDRGN